MILTPPSRILQPRVGARVNWRDPMTKGLVGYWIFNQGSGSTVTDITGHGWDVGPGDEGVWRATKYGTGMQFSSALTEDLQTTGIPVSGPPVTFVAWFHATPPSTWFTPVFTGWTGHGSYHHGLSLTSSTGVYNYYHRSGASQSEAWTGPVPADLEIMMTGVSASGTSHKLYVDGVLRDSGTVADNWTNYDFFSIGAILDSSPSYGNGTIHQIAVFNRALTDAEILRLYLDPFAMVERSPIIIPAEIAGGSTYNETASSEAAAVSSAVDTAVFAEPVGAQAAVDATAGAIDLFLGVEAVTAEAGGVASASDTLVAVESATAAAGLTVSASDTLIAAESVSASAEGDASATDTSTPTETVSAAADAQASQSDTAVFVETASAESQAACSAVDAASFAASVSATADGAASALDTAILLEAVSAGATAECSALDSTAPSELVTVEAATAASANDSLAAVESVSVVAAADSFAVAAVLYVDPVAAQVYGVVAALDTGVFAEPVAAEASAVCTVIDTVPSPLGLIHPFLLIQKTR